MTNTFNGTKPRMFILSAERAGATPGENVQAHAALNDELTKSGHLFRPVLGQYKGTNEAAFLVSGAAAEMMVKVLAIEFNQDTYLAISENDRAAYEVDVATGYHRHVGKLYNEGTTEPDVSNWTKVHDNYFCTWVVGPLVDLPEGF